LPHGITEMTAIVLCGGVGLLIGSAVVQPGRVSRWAALAAAGRDAGRTCVGIAVMLVAAAVLESYLRQSHLTTGQRLCVAAISALFWIGYFAWGGVRERSASLTGDHAPAIR
jgi:uncharacterized membrane protein SpoIIM required for sporulation